MTRYVFDSSVIVAILERERGYENALPFLEKAIASTVNIAEVATRFAIKGIPEDYVQKLIKSTNIQLHTYGEDVALVTGMLVQQTKSFGLSLGDRACIALGITKKLPILTADRIWQKLDIPVQIKLMR